MEAARTEETQQSDDDQVDRDDIVEQARHDQDQDASDKRYQRTSGQSNVHSILRCAVQVITYDSTQPWAIDGASSGVRTREVSHKTFVHVSGRLTWMNRWEAFDRWYQQPPQPIGIGVEYQRRRGLKTRSSEGEHDLLANRAYGDDCKSSVYVMVVGVCLVGVRSIERAVADYARRGFQRRSRCTALTS